MKFDALQEAILSKDVDAVVAAIADWTEADRESAIDPFNVLMMAIGFDGYVVPPCDLKTDSPSVKQKRVQDQLEFMSHKKRNIDYEKNRTARLARYGIESVGGCKLMRSVAANERQAAQIMADRRPPWLEDWYTYVCDGDHGGISASYWSLLYQHQLLSADDFPPMADMFAGDLTNSFETEPEATQKVLREVEACRELIYEVPKNGYQLYVGKSWEPLVRWICGEGLLDQTRMLKALIDALHTPLNQTERNGAVIIAKAIGADASVLAQLQPQWLGLLADSQASVVGFAVDQLRMLEKSGQLNAKEAVAALPSVFVHKPKTHVKKAVDMLGRIATDESLRGDAVLAVTSALMHPNKDVQKATIAILASHLRPEDADAIRSIELSIESISATLKKSAEALLQFDQAAAPAKKIAKATKSAAKTGSMAATNARDGVDLSDLQQAIDLISQPTRERLRITQALHAAAEGRIDQTCRWSTSDMRIVSNTQPISTIETVEELVDVTAAAVEKCDSADTVDRILGGIVRLYRERPPSFDAMTKSLANRACEHISLRPVRGIVGGFLGFPFSLLIGAWLGVSADEDDYDYLNGPIQQCTIEIEQRVRNDTAYPLLCEATHSGGWIDPSVWVARLINAQEQQFDLLKTDLLRSCLRLTPDGRADALQAAQSLKPPLQAIALAALGGDVKIDDSWPPALWIAALRARDPWIDLSQHLAPGDQGVISDDIAQLPDVVYPANYQWKVTQRTQAANHRGLVDASPMPDSAGDSSPQQQDVMSLLLGGLDADGDIMGQLAQLAQGEKAMRAAGGFFTAQLHHIPCYPAPAYAYPYLASQWPIKLDWYWNMAASSFSRRVESRSSVDEPFFQYLLPLLEQDRPLTKMAARALWIATVSKDDTARSMAVETWIALAGDDRCDVETMVETLVEVCGGGWVKFNRVGDVAAEVAAVSPLHAWVMASVLEGYLLARDPFPKDVAKLLEPLDECCEQLGRAIDAQLASRLESIKSGKAKPLAKSLRDRVDSSTDYRSTAVLAALEARLSRAKRWES